MRRRGFISNHYGFTLIEIIAVLIILGILAAVAVPKYLDMTSDAHEAAIDGALAAAVGDFQMELSDFLALNKVMPNSLADINLGVGITIGDFIVSYVGDGTNVAVTVTNGPTWFANIDAAIVVTKDIPSTLQ